MIFKVVKFLAKLSFAISLFLSISILSILGTIIEQDQSIEFYQKNYPSINPLFGLFSWKTIIFFGLNEIYHKWWFLILLFIFGLSLISCTFTQQYPTLKFVKKSRFIKNPIQYKKLNSRWLKENLIFGKIFAKLQNRTYSIFQSNEAIYAYKGLIGKVSPILVHFSMILILLGAIQGALTGFTAQELVPKSEIFHIQNLIRNGVLSIVPSSTYRVDDFWIGYTQNQKIKQFYSKITILNSKAKLTKSKTISVNNPLNYNGITIYQTDWTILGIRLKVWDKVKKTCKIIQLPVLKTKNNGVDTWLTWFKVNNEEISIFVDTLADQVFLYDKNGTFKKTVNIGEYLDNQKTIGLVEIIPATGLQIKTDPGIPLIYFGFALLMLSIVGSYISFSQIWLNTFSKKLVLGGKTNRAKLQFEEELLELETIF